MLLRSLLLSTLLLASALAAHAQQNTPPSPLPSAAPNRDDGPPRRGDLGSPTEEMLGRAAIKNLEENHKETVERAREAAQLGAELRSVFRKGQPLGRDELKKLERMEKLSRSIRGRVGGSDDDDPLADPPRDLEAAFGRLADTSEDLRKSVEKTSRHVVSAAVIERANDLLQLIRVIRAFTP